VKNEKSFSVSPLDYVQCVNCVSCDSVCEYFEAENKEYHAQCHLHGNALREKISFAVRIY
jgi:hypothetical protein